MIDWFVASLGTQAIVHTVAASVGPQVQNIIRPRYKNYCKAVAERFGRAAPPDVNHDLQRLLGVVYADCGERWLKSLPDLPEHEDYDGTHRQFKQLCWQQLQDFKTLMGRRDLKPENATKEEQGALELMLKAIPEVQLDDADYGHVTESLTEGFKALVGRLTGGTEQGVPMPDRFAATLQIQENGHTSFGHEVLRRYIECLKNGDNPEASRAFDFHAFGLLREELAKLQEDADSADVKRSLDAAKLEFANLGASIKDTLLRLENHADQLARLALEQKELLAEITRWRIQLNLLTLDAKPKHKVESRDSFLQMRFDQRQTVFTGREGELALLFSFLIDASPLRWWQVSGAAGQGKSRLALHLVDLIRGDWDAGFLSADALEETDWNKIEVVKPTLIVVDYLASAGKTDNFVKAFTCLAGRVAQNDHRLGQPIRFLILERQGYGIAAKSGKSRGIGWYDQVESKDQAAIRSVDHEFRPSSRDVDGTVSTSLELFDLDPGQMVEIANSWRAHVQMDRSTGEPLSPLTKKQAQQLLSLMAGRQHMQNPDRYPRKAWRPLFAMMIGQFVSQFDGGAAFDDKTISQILEQVLKSEKEENWPRDDGQIRSYTESVWNLACLATMIGQYDHGRAQQIFSDIGTGIDFDQTLFLGPFNSTQFEAANTVLGYRVRPEVGSSGVSPLLGREPDLLGEFMVLKELSDQLAFDRDAAETRLKILVACAIALSPEGFAQFMIRVSEDFGALDSAKTLFAVPIPALSDVASAPISLNGTAYYGFTGMAEALIHAGADVHEPHESGATPLLFAAQEGHEAIVNALLSAGAGKNTIDFSLLQAAQQGHDAIVNALLSAGADASIVNEENGTFPLLQAAQNGHDAIVNALLSAGADANTVNEENGTFPLLQAAQNGHDAIVNALLSAGADANTIDKQDGTFPLLMAAQEGHDAIVNALLSAGADASTVNEQRGTFPLLIAAENGHDAIVNALLSAGADANTVNEENGTFPLLMAAQNGHDAIVNALLSAGADANTVNEENGTFPLLQAAQNGHDAIVNALLSAGADANTIDKQDGTFPLLMAAQEGHDAIVNALLSAGADANTVSEQSGAFPLLMAAQNGHDAIVNALLSAGADANTVREQSGAFPLLMAAQNGHDAIVNALLSAGADANTIDKQDGTFPLLMAAQNGHEAVVKALLSAGAHASTVNEQRGTFPLLMAAQEGHDAIVNALLSAGADARQRHQADDVRPADMAVANQHDAIVRLLAKAVDVSVETLREEAIDRLGALAAKRRDKQSADWIAGLESNRAWPVPNILPADWTLLSDENAIRDILSVLVAGQGQGRVQTGTPRMVQAAPLGFYPDWMVVEVLLEKADGKRGIATFLVDEEGGFVLDGTSGPIHALNQTEAKPLRLTDEQAALDYLRFFCAFIQSDEGPFRIIETVGDAQLTETVSDEVMKSLEEALKPSKCSRSDGGVFHISATTAYGQAVFHAQFEVSPDGIVLMVDDEPKMVELPFTQYRFVDGLRTIATS